MPKKTTKVAKQKIKQLLQKSRAKAKQGYDDREDERLGMTRGKVAKKDFVGTMKEKEKSRRDDAGFETRNMAKGSFISKYGNVLVWDIKRKEYGLVLDGHDGTYHYPVSYKSGIAKKHKDDLAKFMTDGDKGTEKDVINFFKDGRGRLMSNEIIKASGIDEKRSKKDEMAYRLLTDSDTEEKRTVKIIGEKEFEKAYGRKPRLDFAKKEYGGILQDMTGGVNQDPRFDIYNTGQFGEDGMLVEYADPATKVTPLLAKMAMGGPTEHGLQQGDIILLIKGDYIGVVNDNTGKMATINIATGERTAVERLEDGGVLAKMRPDKIVNQEAREYVENMIDFIGNNLSGLTMSNGDYLVSSFGYYPIWYYDKREKKWYGNTDKFSVTTAKHSSQTRPTYDAVMVSSDTLNEVISRAQDGNRFKRYGGTV